MTKGLEGVAWLTDRYGSAAVGTVRALVAANSDDASIEGATGVPRHHIRLVRDALAIVPVEGELARPVEVLVKLAEVDPLPLVEEIKRSVARRWYLTLHGALDRIGELGLPAKDRRDLAIVAGIASDKLLDLLEGRKSAGTNVAVNTAPVHITYESAIPDIGSMIDAPYEERQNE